MAKVIVQEITPRRAIVDFDTASGAQHRVEVIANTVEDFQAVLDTTEQEVLTNTSVQE